MTAAAKVGLATLAAAIAVASVQAQSQPTTFTRAPMTQPAAPGEIETLHVRDNIYVLMGAGGNITVSVGADGVFMVDSGQASMTDRVLAAVRQLQNAAAMKLVSHPLGWGAETRSSVADRFVPPPPKPIRFIVNTHLHPDHVGGNETLRNSGRTFTGGNVAGDIRDSGEGAAIYAHEKVLLRMVQRAAGQPEPPVDSLPTDTYYVESYKLSHFFNGEGIQLFHAPAGHTDGDSIVYFRRADVVAMGDLMFTDHYPIIDVDRGGTINGIVDGLNRVLDMAIPEFRLEGGTMMVPGHGRLVDSGDVAYYRDMLTIVRDRVEGMVKKGMTLAQVRAAKPTADYDPVYGANNGAWTTDQFVEAVYKTLGGGRAGTPARGRR
jgi:glyoxylase-like metal-dependent hydrolase (beta-lactamase superfamily II)